MGKCVTEGILRVFKTLKEKQLVVGNKKKI